MSDHENDDLVSPGSTATGSGTSVDEPTTEGGLDEIGTTEADVSDGSEQKLPKID